MRSNHNCLFKTIFVCIIFVSFLFPIYNLVLLDIQPKFAIINGTNTTLNLCNVPDHSKKLYVDLTIFFVSSTLAIPFLGKLSADRLSNNIDIKYIISFCIFSHHYLECIDCGCHLSK